MAVNNASLATKYRPRVFSDVTEQSLVVDIVKKLCESETLPCRNFLFIGSSGVGKTTICRIIANELNQGLGEPIEIDAASHSGVEHMREIVQQAQQYPVGSKYKVFIIDECFPGNTWISTPSGKIQIKDICEGDRVYNLTGTAAVTRLFRNTVKTSNLICLRLGRRNVITTKDHLFFTDCGWIPAQDLKQGDVLYDHSTMQAMRKRIHSEVRERSESSLQSGVPQDLYSQQAIRSTYSSISQRVSSMWKDVLDRDECECHNLLCEVWKSMEETESRYGEVVGATCKTLAYIYLSRMREADRDPEQRLSDSVFVEMRDEDSIKESRQTPNHKSVSMVWEYIYSELIGKQRQENLFASMPNRFNDKPSHRSEESRVVCEDVSKQSDVKSGHNCKDVGDERKEWNLTQTSCIAWWERTLHESADDVAGSFGTGVEVRVSSSNQGFEKQQSESLSYELQTRPRLSKVSSRCRGGWCRPSYEIASVVRREESDASSAVRVDSVEIYKRGDNDELFWSSFSDSELSQDYVTMYDLEIAGHPSYYANDVLVHNCHALSAASWQSALKVLEEGPARSIFMFATTNPEKIPETILSRVQTFQLSKISLDGIVSRLKYIIEQENKEGHNITYEDSAIQFIGKLAEGGMRASITLLDKALAYSNNITSEGLVQALNLPAYDDYFSLLASYAKHNNEGIAKLIHKVYNSGVNFVKWFEGFHAFVINIVKYIFMQDIECTMIPSHYKDKVSNYGPKHSIICLKLANKLLKLNAELKTTSYLQEVALTYLCEIPRKEG